MSYYFSADGTMKYSTKTKSSIMNYVKSSASDLSASASSTSSSSSSFSKEMKSAALAASGKLSSTAKDAARANNKDYQRLAALQARIQAIQARKPRTFDDEDNYTINTSVLSKYATAQENYKSYKKTPNTKSSSS